MLSNNGRLSSSLSKIAKSKFNCREQRFLIPTLRIMVDATPFRRLAPSLLVNTFFPDFVRRNLIRAVEVVLPLVPAITMIFKFLFFSITCSMNLLLIFRAICPGQVEPEPRLKSLLTFIISLPNKIIYRFIYLTNT